MNTFFPLFSSLSATACSGNNTRKLSRGADKFIRTSKEMLANFLFYENKSKPKNTESEIVTHKKEADSDLFFPFFVATIVLVFRVIINLLLSKGQ